MKRKKTSNKKRIQNSVRISPWVHLSDAISDYLNVCSLKNSNAHATCTCQRLVSSDSIKSNKNRFAVMDDGSEVSTQVQKSALEELHPLQLVFIKHKANL